MSEERRFVRICMAMAVGVLAGVLFPGLLAVNRMPQHSAEALPWPEHLGPLTEVPGRFPERPISPAAKELIRLAAPLGIDFAKPGSRSTGCCRRI